jgi:hypothetical protein
MLKLVIRSGPQAGMEIPVDQPFVRLGRGSGSEIVLQDTQISRQHAEISRQGDRFFIRDLGSTNGTFVNNRQVTDLRPLQSGDQIRIGNTTLACEVMLVGAPAAAAAATDWEAQLWDEDMETGQPAERSRLLMWVLVGAVVVLLAAVAVAAALLLRDGGKVPAPVAEVETEAATAAIVVAPTETQESVVVAEPTVTPLVDLPTVEPLPTVEIKASAPAVEAPASKPPSGVPSGPADLEQLPASVSQMLGDIPSEQLPEAIASQMQSLSPDQLQGMIGALFPGVDPGQLPQVVAASFPELAVGDIEGLLGIAFPGQSFQLPEAGPVGGRIALGIFDPDRPWLDLYVVNAIGGEPVRLVEEASEPDFAPDGQWLVYYSAAPDRLGLRLIRTDGTEDTQLTSSKSHGYPTFSPNGQRISFFDYDLNALRVMNRDGTGDHEIGKGEYPAWSPTGDQVVYRGCVSGGRCGLVVAGADGSNPTQITTHANDAAPRWSPNGGQIVFHSDRDGNWEIYVINSDGSWLRRITLNPTTDIMPVWSPDGLRIAFRSDRGGQGAVWVTSGIGGGATKMFDAALSPEWMWDQMDWAN